MPSAAFTASVSPSREPKDAPPALVKNEPCGMKSRSYPQTAAGRPVGRSTLRPCEAATVNLSPAFDYTPPPRRLKANQLPPPTTPTTKATPAVVGPASPELVFDPNVPPG